MTFNYFFSFKVHLPSEKDALVMRESILPEIDSRHQKRSKVSVNSEKNVLSIEINSNDRTALQASFNAYFKSVILINDLIGGIKNEQSE